jgi:hypothetical protein
LLPYVDFSLIQKVIKHILAPRTPKQKVPNS